MMVHSPPISRSQKLKASLVSTLIFTQALTAPLQAHAEALAKDVQDASQTKEQLKKLETEIDKREASKKQLEQKAAEALKERQSLQVQMVSIGRKLQSTEQSIFLLDSRIGKLQELTNEKRDELLNNKDSMVELIAALQRMGRRPAAASLLKPGEALDTARSASLLSTLLPHIDIKAAALKRDISYLADLYTELSDKRFSLKTNLSDLAQQQVILKNLVARREIEETDARAAARGESLRISRLVRSSRDTRDLLQKLEEESKRFQARQARLKRASEARAAAERRQNNPAVQPQTVAPTPSGVSFRSLRGKMPYPSYGKLILKYGQRDGVGRAKGIRLSVRSGSQVISPFEGRVVYAGPFREYGQLVIIAHKDGYHGLLAGISTLYTALNQWVLLGEPVGQVAGGASRTSQLYFELRGKDGPFNPLPWLKSN
ncbi:peptidoglycan DD-metalloendopeptidase family protein [Temperatibacter marinus]|uniref:Peptidoglycan DD-metalloendopeptidase family protein n=1 Tax=Temperatibacter marinus TaxID=1456591 RepID=A0AA52EA04_9PROT|nr:peptidoglycan DD-metalloendopeptidase family protein [Temperatibacter marinus]WND01442.1 peptidoglycan DD-metalloendopeptidase family protein [Temperatibacter marinus]